MGGAPALDALHASNVCTRTPGCAPGSLLSSRCASCAGSFFSFVRSLYFRPSASHRCRSPPPHLGSCHAARNTRSVPPSEDARGETSAPVATPSTPSASLANPLERVARDRRRASSRLSFMPRTFRLDDLFVPLSLLFSLSLTFHPAGAPFSCFFHKRPSAPFAPVLFRRTATSEVCAWPVCRARLFALSAQASPHRPASPARHPRRQKPSRPFLRSDDL